MVSAIPSPDSGLERKGSYTPVWAAEEFIVPLLGQTIEQLLKDWAVPGMAFSKALDIGCGEQPFRNHLESLGYLYIGFDINQNMSQTVQVIGAIDQSLPLDLLSLGSFHFILITEVMEHVADWNQAFCNIAALLTPQGRVLITCPHFYPLHEEPHDFWRPTLHALRYFGTRVGLKEVYAASLGDTWAVLGTLMGELLAAGQIAPIDRNIMGRLTAKLMRGLVKGTFWLLQRGWLQQQVSLQSRLYLSNVIVFEKPEP
jgi:SAM-dependent methyltransferase